MSDFTSEVWRTSTCASMSTYSALRPYLRQQKMSFIEQHDSTEVAEVRQKIEAIQETASLVAAVQTSRERLLSIVASSTLNMTRTEGESLEVLGRNRSIFQILELVCANVRLLRGHGRICERFHGSVRRHIV